jgi:hypothetical protein
VPIVIDPADVATVARQLGRRPRPFARVASRCPAGRAAVVEQPSRDPNGSPFPTTYWLTCPGLVARIGLLEAGGGVAALEARLVDDPPLAAGFDRARARQIALRPDLGDLGIGGTRAARTVKCLHAHAAFALGAGDYEIGEEIVAAAGGFPTPCCLEEPR